MLSTDIISVSLCKQYFNVLSILIEITSDGKSLLIKQHPMESPLTVFCSCSQYDPLQFIRLQSVYSHCIRLQSLRSTSAIGATMAFMLSRCFASIFVRRFFPVRVNTLRRRVTAEEKNGSLFYFLLFLRLFPVSPNWLLNILSPLAGERTKLSL